MQGILHRIASQSIIIYIRSPNSTGRMDKPEGAERCVDCTKHNYRDHWVRSFFPAVRNALPVEWRDNRLQGSRDRRRPFFLLFPTISRRRMCGGERVCRKKMARLWRVSRLCVFRVCERQNIANKVHSDPRRDKAAVYPLGYITGRNIKKMQMSGDFMIRSGITRRKGG